MFSTTFCSRACCGAPEEAKAPPSIITSFCMSWMMSAQRDGSRWSPPLPPARSGPDDEAAALEPADAVARMNGSARGPILVRTA